MYGWKMALISIQLAQPAVTNQEEVHYTNNKSFWESVPSSIGVEPCGEFNLKFLFKKYSYYLCHSQQQAAFNLRIYVCIVKLCYCCSSVLNIAAWHGMQCYMPLCLSL